MTRERREIMMTPSAVGANRTGTLSPLRLAIPRPALQCREFAQETCSNQRWRRWIILAERWKTCRLHQGQDMPSSTAGDRRSATCHRRCYVIPQRRLRHWNFCDLSTAVRVLLCDRFTDWVSLVNSLASRCALERCPLWLASSECPSPPSRYFSSHLQHGCGRNGKLIPHGLL